MPPLRDKKEAEELAAVSDAMIVIGGKNSSNSRKLFEISKNQCEKHLFYTDIRRFGSGADSIFVKPRYYCRGIHPKNIIQEVLEACQKKEVLRNY